ncbi:MAG: TlpA family protein disulfide reductase [Burkholderiales bacterium]
MMFKEMLRAILLLLALWSPQIYAQTVPLVQGSTTDGKPFELGSLKGKVVLLMFWSTSCPVCRDKMPEIRQNHDGWAGKPFEVVLVSTDKRIKDLDDYEKVLARTVPMTARQVWLWSGDQSYKDNLGSHPRLPATYVIDKTGKVVERYAGRIPAEAWDKISDLF